MCYSINHIDIAAEGPTRERGGHIDGCEAVQQYYWKQFVENYGMMYLS